MFSRIVTFSGMYTSVGTGDILVRMLRSWGEIQVDQRRSRRMNKKVQYSLALSHVLQARANVLTHIDIFSGMSLTGQDIQQEWFHQFLGENCPDTKSLANMVNDHFISLTSDFVPLTPSGVTNQQVRLLLGELVISFSDYACVITE